MSLLGYVIAFAIGFIIVLLLGYFKRKAFSTVVIIGAVLAGFTVLLAAHLRYSVSSVIEEKERITRQEAAVIERLELIREAELAYIEVNGNYTSDWDKLISFIDTGKFPIVQRIERVITLSYGADSSVITFDTLGMISAKDRIFKATHNVNAANDGVFEGFKVKEGEEVKQGSNAYVLNQDGRNVTHKFRRSGTVTRLESVKEGQNVSKGQLLITLEETKFDENINLEDIPYVPGRKNVKFDIFATEVDKNGTIVDVIEVKNPQPFDPTRSEDAESRTRQPLRFGSKTDVTTSGNWE